jgi:ElaB/YqjD/DUF883 family membrane-anchored ribosome-binding protein
LREGVGHVQDAVGGLVGDNPTQIKGKLNEAAGSMQKTYGEVSDAVTHRAKDLFSEFEGLAKARPLAAVGIGVSLGLLCGLLVTRRDRAGRSA